jgi:hypothetical protein
MKHEDIVVGQFYLIEAPISMIISPELESLLAGTNHVVKVTYIHDAFLICIEHYPYTIHCTWIKCWVPGVGELAEFSDNGKDWTEPLKFVGYLLDHDISYPFRESGGSGYKYARPVQEKIKQIKPELCPVDKLVSYKDVKKIVKDEVNNSIKNILDTLKTEILIGNNNKNETNNTNL